MKFKDSGSKGTRVIERKRSVTDGQTDGQTDKAEGGRHNYGPMFTSSTCLYRISESTSYFSYLLTNVPSYLKLINTGVF